MKKFISIALTFIMLMNILIALPVSSSEPPPVWKIAFVSLPSYLDDDGEYWEREEVVEEAFFKAADEFENWIETKTEYPLDIQIVKISSVYKMEYDKTKAKVGGALRGAFDPEGHTEYRLDEYDTVVWGTPQRYYKGGIAGEAGPYDIRLVLVYDTTTMLNMFRGVLIHEFLHVTECWHRNYHGYGLPIEVATTSKGGYYYTYDLTAPIPPAAVPYRSILNGVSDSSVHHKDLFGYYGMGADGSALRFFADWLNNRIPDPYYGKPGHPLEFLGMTEEMWREETPTMLGFPATSKPQITPEDEFNAIGWDTDLGSDLAAHKVRSTSLHNAYIDLDKEVLILPSNYSVAAYSLNGGLTWKVIKGGADSIKISKSILSKASTIRLTDKYDTKLKRPSDDSIIATFPTIQARPRIEKLKPNYGIEFSSSGDSSGSWVLSPKGRGKDSIYEGYEVAISSNRKTPDNGWQKMPSEGLPILPYTEKSATWLVRKAPILNYATKVYIPASKTWKIKPAVQKKPPKVKANYQKEIISLKKGMALSWNGTVYTAEKSEKYSITEILDATSSGETATIKLWMVAVDKKPSSAQQIYKLAKRAKLEPKTLEVKNGKIVSPKELEFLNPSKGTWGSAPKFTSTQVVKNGVRLKSTAKGNAVDDSNYTAQSFPLDLVVTYGEYSAGKNTREGVVKAEIVNSSGEVD